MTLDQSTADAFATSWNNLPEGSVYSAEQAQEWFAPLAAADIEGRRVLELGCGNASLAVHMLAWKPAYLEGVDLGDSVTSAMRNLERVAPAGWAIRKADLTTYVASEPFDVVYSIGVLHHLKDPQAGFQAVLRNVKRGGRFHCWVYAHEGNAVVRWEWHPGSTLFVAWQQRRSDYGPVGDFAFDRDRRALMGTRPDNIYLVKLNWWLVP